jgi:hypothetical protein
VWFPDLSINNDNYKGGDGGGGVIAIFIVIIINVVTLIFILSRMHSIDEKVLW